MDHRERALIALVGLALASAGCSSVTQVTAEELAPVVERDAVAFSEQAIPDPVLDRLAAHQVVLLGETHHLREHYEFVAALLHDLHPRGFRQLLVEWPHMADWLLEDYVADGQLIPNWEPPVPLGRAMLAAIRDFNDTLPAAERVHVRAIDVNLDDYGGASSFRNLLGTVAESLPEAGPLSAFLAADYNSATAQTAAVQDLRASLDAQRATLTASWGATWYDAVVEMADVELASIDIRARRESQYDWTVRTREEVIKQLADARISGTSDRTLINVGSTHAQKSRLRGGDLEWLGDYLVHQSAAVDGSIIILGITAATIELEPGATGTAYDVRDASPANELFRVMFETWPEQTVFLPLDDPLFAADGVPMNFEGTIYVTAPKTQYDAVLQYALAHRVPNP
jgi:hypothetical protein